MYVGEEAPQDTEKGGYIWAQVGKKKETKINTSQQNSQLLRTITGTLDHARPLTEPFTVEGQGACNESKKGQQMYNTQRVGREQGGIYTHPVIQSYKNL